MIIDTGLGWRANSNYLVNDANTYLSTQSYAFYKINTGYAVAVHFHTFSNNYYGPILISTVAENVYYTNNVGVITTFEYLGLTWYVSPTNMWNGSPDTPAIVSYQSPNNNIQAADMIHILELAEVSLTPITPTYTIVFDSNGGTGSMENQTVEVDAYTTLDLCTFVREGYTFIGWSASSTGSVNYTDGDTVYNLAAEGETATLYAVWRKNPPYLIIQENKSEIISLTKELIDILQTPFTLKDETSIIDPVFVINCPLDLLFRANYLTAPSLGRKYFIQDIVSMTNDLVELTCHVDVLSTYADEIKANKGIVHRQENNWNLYLNDGVLQVYQNPIVTTQAFPDGFKENNFVLVTAGTRGLKGVDIGEGGEVDIENDLGAGNNESRTTGGLSWYAQQQVGKPYWYGTFGNIASADLYNYKKIQYPSYYTASDFPSQYGQKVHDCVGIIKGYRWGTYPYTAEPTYVPEQDVDVRGLYNQCIRYRGDIARSPLGDIITDLYEGCCVFYGDMTHVGVYIGNDQVAEAKSHADGVVITDIKQRTGFTLWGVPDWIKITTTYL